VGRRIEGDRLRSRRLGRWSRRFRIRRRFRPCHFPLPYLPARHGHRLAPLQPGNHRVGPRGCTLHGGFPRSLEAVHRIMAVTEGKIDRPYQCVHRPCRRGAAMTSTPRFLLAALLVPALARRTQPAPRLRPGHIAPTRSGRHWCALMPVFSTICGVICSVTMRSAVPQRVFRALSTPHHVEKDNKIN
jgi:hypothetical protein